MHKLAEQSGFRFKGGGLWSGVYDKYLGKRKEVLVAFMDLEKPVTRENSQAMCDVVTM
jgi:hypothetical protein